MAVRRSRVLALGFGGAGAIGILGFVAMRGFTAPASDPAAAPARATSTPVAAHEDAAAASASASAAGAVHRRVEPAWGPSPGCPAWSYERGLGRGRKLAVEGKLAEAMTAFEEAIRVAPFDARARAERASVRRRAAERDRGDAGRAEVDVALRELEVAASLTGDRALLAEIAFEVGLADDALGDAEGARVAFATAARQGSAAAAKKLGDRSRCTITVGERVEDLAIVSTWKAALQALRGPGCDAPPTKDEAEARAFACGGCESMEHGWTKGVCAGAGPWTMATGHMSCTSHTGEVVELAPGRLHAFWSIGDAGVLERMGALWLERRGGSTWEGLGAELGGARVDYRPGEGWSDLADADAGGMGGCPGDDVGGAHVATTGCGNLGISRRSASGLVVYDDHGRWRATLLLHDAEAERVKPVVRGDVLEVRGAGCSFDVPLAPR